MIGRFFYHAFWNFYDVMGTLLLWGTAHTLLAIGLIVSGLALVNNGLNIVVMIGIISLLQIFLLSILVSALLPYCARVARGENARWKHLRQGLKIRWDITLVLGIWLLVQSVLIVNFYLYFNLHLQVTSPFYKMAFTLINALVGWTIVVVFILLPPWLCAQAGTINDCRLKAAFKKALLVIAMLPGTWIVTGIIWFILLLTGTVTRVGLILVAPVLVSISQTAFQLSMQYAQFLSDAKDHLGTGCPLKVYKAKAVESILQWEYRQPRRTFKELIKPWDY